MDENITVRDLVNYFGYRRLTGSDNALNRPIKTASINRPGMELMGYLDFTDRRRVIIIGDKEYSYIPRMSAEDQRKSFDFLTNDLSPMILMSHDHPLPDLLHQIANQKDFPIFSSFADTSSLTIEVTSFLEEKLAKTTSIHGVLMNIYGVGVLIRGESGVGKSEIALELLKKGHYLVADDRVDIARVHNKIHGTCPELLRDMLEVRGIGIINATAMFGVTCTMHDADIGLVIDLKHWTPDTEIVRTGNEENEYEDFFGVKIQKITLPVSEGRSMAAIIESAVTNHLLLQRGINSPLDFENRVVAYINRKKQEDSEK